MTGKRRKFSDRELQKMADVLLCVMQQDIWPDMESMESRITAKIYEDRKEIAHLMARVEELEAELQRARLHTGGADMVTGKAREALRSVGHKPWDGVNDGGRYE